MSNYKRIRTYRDFAGELTVTYTRTSKPKEKITSSREAYQYLYKYFDECMDSHEEFKVLHLSNVNRVVNIDHHTKGSKKSCLVDTSIVVRNALLIMTTGIIIAHNHPSGSPKPSANDRRMTKEIRLACQTVGLNLIDSIILTREGYYSFADNGDL